MNLFKLKTIALSASALMCSTLVFGMQNNQNGTPDKPLHPLSKPLKIRNLIAQTEATAPTAQQQPGRPQIAPRPAGMTDEQYYLYLRNLRYNRNNNN